MKAITAPICKTENVFRTVLKWRKQPTNQKKCHSLYDFVAAFRICVMCKWIRVYNDLHNTVCDEWNALQSFVASRLHIYTHTKTESMTNPSNYHFIWSAKRSLARSLIRSHFRLSRRKTYLFSCIFRICVLQCAQNLVSSGNWKITQNNRKLNAAVSLSSGQTKPNRMERKFRKLNEKQQQQQK